MSALPTILFCVSAFFFGAATGTAVAACLVAYLEWRRAIRRWQLRRGLYQLTYRSDPCIGPHRDRGSRAVREPLTTSM